MPDVQYKVCSIKKHGTMCLVFDAPGIEMIFNPMPCKKMYVSF